MTFKKYQGKIKWTVVTANNVLTGVVVVIVVVTLHDPWLSRTDCFKTSNTCFLNVQKLIAYILIYNIIIPDLKFPEVKGNELQYIGKL